MSEVRARRVGGDRSGAVDDVRACAETQLAEQISSTGSSRVVNRAVSFVFLTLCLSAAVIRAEPPAEGRLPITISKEATYITEPLRPDGYPDYLAALNQEASKGVTPENNAVVLLMQAFGPGVIEPRCRDRFFKLLGIDALLEEGEYFVNFVDFIQKHAPASLNDRDKHGNYRQSEAMRQYWRSIRRPWSKKTCPLVAAWLAASEEPLLRVVEASNRSRFYLPAVPRRKNVDMSFDFSILSLIREVAHAFRARCLLRIQEDDIEQAWSDLQTCHRLGRLVSQGPTSTECLTACTLYGIAHAGDWQYAHFAQLTAEQIEKCRDDVRQFTSFASIVEKVRIAERFVYLDHVCATARGDLKPDFQGGELFETAMKWIESGDVDWDQMLRWGNEQVDEIMEAAHKSTRQERVSAVASLDQKRYTKCMRFKPGGSRTVGNAAMSKSHDPIATPGLFAIYAKWFFCQDGIEAIVDADDRMAVYCNLADIGFALAAYRAKHGQYPEELSSLVPEYIAKLPEDLFSKGLLRYRRQDAGYLLYSVGPNGIDNTGPRRACGWDKSDPPELSSSDDIGIRMPERLDPDDAIIEDEE